MAAGEVAVSNAVDVTSNVQRIEAGSLLPHGTAIASAVEAQAIAEAKEWSNGRQAQAASRIAEAESTGAGAYRRCGRNPV